MMITKTINMDLWIHERTQEIYAVQGDAATRKIELRLFANKEPWIPKDGASLVIRYRKPDGTIGSYDTLPDGEKAWELQENTASIILAPQMLTVSGRVEVQLEIVCEKQILASFAVYVLVEKNVAAGATRSQSYFNWLHRMEIKLQEMLKAAKESGIFNGATGATPDLQIGSVSTVDAGKNAAAWIEGTAEKPVIHLQIPKGADAVVDASLSAAGQAADAAAVGAALAAKAPAIESAEHPGCYYRVVNGITEWLNPPVAAGLEYRTTKRWNGKPVYKQLLAAGSLPAAGAVHLNIPTSGIIDYIISAKGVVNPQRIFPSSVVAGAMKIDLETTSGGVDVYVSHDWLGGAQFFVTVEYTLI